MLRRLSDPPAPGEVVRLRGAVLSIPGNGVHASKVITLSPDELVFTADNYTRGGATGRTLLRASYVGECKCPSQDPEILTTLCGTTGRASLCAMVYAGLRLGALCSTTAVHSCPPLRPLVSDAKPWQGR